MSLRRTREIVTDSAASDPVTEADVIMQHGEQDGGGGQRLLEEERPLRTMSYFALLGNTFGGNGRNTFNLPDLQGKEPVPGMHDCISIQGRFPMRD